MQPQAHSRTRSILALFLCTVLVLSALRGEVLAKEDSSDFGEAPIELLLTPSPLPSLFLLGLPFAALEEPLDCSLRLEDDNLPSIEETVLLPGHGASDLSPPQLNA
jgi:hypothetical protein